MNKKINEEIINMLNNLHIVETANNKNCYELGRIRMAVLKKGNRSCHQIDSSEQSQKETYHVE